MAKHKQYPMLTSNPKHKRHGRLPGYGPRMCPWCGEKLKLGANGLFCDAEIPNGPVNCGWKENP